MNETLPKLVVITGPTAAGKTSLAVELAGFFGGEVINADSMQVYRGMDIGTAKPTSKERNHIPHHLIDVVDPDESFSAAAYRKMALPKIQEVLSRVKIPFVVGGTGLYIRVLLGGLLDCAPSDPALRDALRREWEDSGPESLHEKLAGLDPESAGRIHPHDRVRVLRALEITLTSGRPLSFLKREHKFRERSFDALKICLQMERDRLYDRINERSACMIENGLLEETERLLERGYSPELKSMQSLGYRHMVKVISGEWELDHSLNRLRTDTRRYAKRQLTWFRADPEMRWMNALEPGRKDVCDAVKGFLSH